MLCLVSGLVVWCTADLGIEENGAIRASDSVSYQFRASVSQATESFRYITWNRGVTTL